MYRNNALQLGMREAMRQMRSGGLHQATATIQRTLQGLTPNASASASPADDEDAIEGSFYVVPADALPPPTSNEAYKKEAHAKETTVPFRARDGRQWRFAKPLHQPDLTPTQRSDEKSNGQFISGSYSNPAGTRAYKLYIPSGYAGRILPLLVMLHGCTQGPDDFAAGTCMNSFAEEHHCFVLYPAQAPSANPNKCWNWYETAHQQCGQGEPSIIAGLTRHISSSYAVDRNRIYIAGLSAGGAMAAIMGRTYPDLYAAIGVHSGLPYAAAHDLPSAFAAMNQMGAPIGRQRNTSRATATQRFVPTIVFHGNMDKTVHPRNGDEVITQSATLYSCNDTDTKEEPQVTLRRGQVPNGHAYTRAVYRNASGQALLEQWRIEDAGHAWSGGSPRGSYTDPKGPSASREMIRFFYENKLG